MWQDDDDECEREKGGEWESGKWNGFRACDYEISERHKAERKI